MPRSSKMKSFIEVNTSPGRAVFRCVLISRIFSRIYPQYDPESNDSSHRWIRKETSTALKALRFEQDLNQAEVADGDQTSFPH